LPFTFGTTHETVGCATGWTATWIDLLPVLPPFNEESLSVTVRVMVRVPVEAYVWLVVGLAVVVVVPSPQLYLYDVIESPGNGALLPDALKTWETPTVTVPGL
jgi:hypothetical protein